MLKSLLKMGFRRLGYHIDKIDRDSLTMEGGVQRIAQRLAIATFIDIGASDGRWTAMTQRYFPNSEFLLIEAQEVHRKDLEKFTGAQVAVNFVIAAAGDSEGEIYFDASDPHAGLASKTPLDIADCISVPLVRVDKEVRKRKLKPPYALKLDTHGFEVPIFEGAAQIWEQLELIIVEVYNFQIAENSLHFWEMCDYLRQKGFRCADIVDIMRRPKDEMFWQMDMFFIREKRNEFVSNRYEVE
ncbi:MAG: FkbM family methyltransferase [Bernardetiaceae bacterium]|nr:FkbM family methyltransferase [Bernardetiaceae bacterium]